MSQCLRISSTVPYGVSRRQIRIQQQYVHDDVIKWKHFSCNWSFEWGIHRSPVNSPHKGQWRWALMFSLICIWINDWVNNHEAGDLRRYRAYYDVTVMWVMEIFPGKLFSVILTSPFKIYPSFSWSVIEVSVSKSGTEDVCYSSFPKISRYYTTMPQCLLPNIDGLVQDCSNSTVNALE